MPKQKRYSTNYPGVYYVIGKGSDGKPERIYYIRYVREGKKIEERAGRQFQDDMTPANASNLRADRVRGKVLSNAKKREQKQIKKAAEAKRYTINRLWDEYKLNRTPGKGLDIDTNRYENYLKESFGDKEPQDLVKLDVDRIRINLLKKKSPQTVKHILNLLTWIINYGVKNNLCIGVSFHIQKPTVNNEKTEDLTPGQLKALLAAIESDGNIAVGNMMKMALYSGMRRGEIFNLKWKDLSFETGFIWIRAPKGGKDQKIPMNDMTRGLVESIVRTKSPYVFPGKDGKMRVTLGRSGKRIREAAGLPKDFRPMHGLRHAYASMLASSGKVDMYVLQKLMTHKSPSMTQRYAHLRDEALKNGAGQIDDIFK
ncbi:site-specific integrase [uncultured Desulfobacter sp.]|uniref:tyrosine-type recombinase/integrase n=1 Tax=uncultured Desulfobacter sp. TaxID=240139 RepID=UPI002AA69B7F|nr:site-specific integrase [uncultured Desulfobacter sp.]